MADDLPLDDDAEAVWCTSPFGLFRMFRRDRIIRAQLLEFGAHQITDLLMALDVAAAATTILDLGAHVGTFAIPLARQLPRHGRLIAVEGNADTYGLLTANVAANGCANVTAINTVVAPERAAFRPSMDVSVHPNSGGNRFRKLDDPAAAGNSVLIGELIEMAGGPISYIKMDIEGMDLPVMQTVPFETMTHLPVVSFELWEPEAEAWAETIARLQGLGYAVFANVAARNTQLFSYVPWRIEHLRELAGLKLVDLFAMPPGSALANEWLGRHDDPAYQRYARAMREWQSGQTAEALQTVSTVGSRTAPSRMLESVLSSRLGNLDHAIACAGRALDLEPRNAAYCKQLSVLMRRAKRVEGAVEWARRAVQLEPLNSDYRLHLAEALLMEGSLALAATINRTARLINPFDHRLFVQCARIQACAGAPQAAIASVRQAVALDEYNARLKSYLGDLLMQEGLLQDAEHAYRAAVRADVRNAQFRLNLSRNLLRQGRTEAGIGEAEAALELAQDDPRLKRHLTELLARSRSGP